MLRTCDHKDCPSAGQVTIHIGDQDVLLCGHHFDDDHEKLYELVDAGKASIEFTDEAEWLRPAVA